MNLVLMELVTPLVGLVTAKGLTGVSLFLAGYVIQSRFVFLQPTGPGDPGVQPEEVLRADRGKASRATAPS